LDLSDFEDDYRARLAAKLHGEMSYLERNIDKRINPEKLHNNTLGIICVRLNYYSENSADAMSILSDENKAYISRYSLGRDYHKIFRKKLKLLAEKIKLFWPDFSYRVFSDSAPILELALAQKSGLGWLGKNNCILTKDNGSWFFLGEIYTNIAFESSLTQRDHCGRCTACIDDCPTNAIVEPYVVDARRCISYLTIEHDGAIPEQFRKAIGNRIYGCDDCQLVCPWNRFSQHSELEDFAIRHNLNTATLLDLFAWTEQEFLDRLEGSAIRRIGWDRWQRNIATALGNAPYSEIIIKMLKRQLGHRSKWVEEHIVWALEQHKG